MKIITLLTLISSFSAVANFQKPVICKTPRENIVIKLENDSLQLAGRFPAESMVQRTSIKDNMVDKVFYVSGDKHTLHIHDKNKFDEFNDSITIQTTKGHEMTYSLSCSNI